MILNRLVFGISLLALLVIGSPSAVSAEENPNRYVSDLYGFQYDKPAEWSFGTPAMWIENLKKAGAPDAAIEQMARNGAIPASYAMKHAEPFEDLNPIFRVSVQQMPPHSDLTLEAIIENAVGGFTKQMPDAKIEKQIAKSKVDGKDAVSASISYNFQQPGSDQGQTVVTGVYFVQRDGLLYVFNHASPKEGPDASQPQFDKMIQSIEFGEIKADLSAPPPGHPSMSGHGGKPAGHPGAESTQMPSGHPPIKQEKPAGHP